MRGGRNGERFADVRSEVVGAVIRQQHQSSYHFPSEYIIALWIFHHIQHAAIYRQRRKHAAYIPHSPSSCAFPSITIRLVSVCLEPFERRFECYKLLWQTILLLVWKQPSPALNEHFPCSTFSNQSNIKLQSTKEKSEFYQVILWLKQRKTKTLRKNWLQLALFLIYLLFFYIFDQVKFTIGGQQFRTKVNKTNPIELNSTSDSSNKRTKKKIQLFKKKLNRYVCEIIEPSNDLSRSHRHWIQQVKQSHFLENRKTSFNWKNDDIDDDDDEESAENVNRKIISHAECVDELQSLIHSTNTVDWIESTINFIK